MLSGTISDEDTSRPDFDLVARVSVRWSPWNVVQDPGNPQGDVDDAGARETDPGGADGE